MTEKALTADRRSFGDRLIAALKLDATVFEEVEHDVDAVSQAAGIVALAGVAQGLGAGGPGGVFPGLLASFTMWILATAIVWAVGVKIFEHTSDFAELLRTLGFAWAPQLLLAIGILPLGPLRALLWTAVFALVVAAFVIAARQALDVSTGRAIFVCLLGVAPAVIFGALYLEASFL